MFCQFSIYLKQISCWHKHYQKKPQADNEGCYFCNRFSKEKKEIQKCIVPPQHLCDELAAHPWDNQRLGIGPAAESSSIKADQAIAACQDAVNEYPQTSRFLFQLGRSYDAKKQYHDALKYYQQAIEHNYVAAQYHL